jgi:mannan endo-1,6-alpha-mannosidase
MIELCDPLGTGPGHCNFDQVNYKGFLSRWMAMTVQMAPFTEHTITPLLKSSATAAMEQCCGTDPNFSGNTACGRQWSMNSTWDGTSGPGQQLSALEVLISTIVKSQPAPLTNSTGGTSASDPTAGFNSSSVEPGSIVTPTTNKDRVGAWILTAIIVASTAVVCYFMASTTLEPVPDDTSTTVPEVRPEKPNYRLSIVTAPNSAPKDEVVAMRLVRKMAP